jgi:hypothetical protein
LSSREADEQRQWRRFMYSSAPLCILLFMYKSTATAAIFLALLLSIISIALFALRPQKASAAAATVVEQNSANASTIMHSGCEDDVVFVQVHQAVNRGGGPQSTATEAFIGGSLNYICDLPSSQLFGETVPVGAGEFTQNGVQGASMKKSVNIDGHDVNIDLVWNGDGVVTRNHSSGTGTSTMQSQTASRSATPSGSFVVDGAEELTPTSLLDASLSDTHTVTVDH